MTMMTAKTFEESKRETCRLFACYVAPVLKNFFNAVEVHDTESYDDEYFKKLDRQNCIDGYLITRDGAKITFASRIQTGDYKSFTVRKSRDTGNPAEYEKICKLIDGGELYPNQFVQSYVRSNGEVEVSLINTEKLIRFIGADKAYTRHTSANKRGQASFYVAEWSVLQKSGIPVKIFNVTHGEITHETKKTA